ncbi:response regulator [Thermosyntropha sp.]|uniref:response regulator n=1 Tax=Thermosyntropha sp. TaxID=2740820 RepID=UPI0025FD1998|nr:response regulator [Thermosyntropha sp.]MBO8158242.1 response regulator [Thermosyntropha sp.]
MHIWLNGFLKSFHENYNGSNMMTGIMEILESFFLLTDEDLNIIKASRGVRNLWNVGRENLEGLSLFTLLSEEELNLIQELLNSSERCKIIHFKTGGDKLRSFKIHAGFLIDSTGREYYVFSGVEISDILYEKNKIEEVSYSKTEFLANISHEIRTSLVGILGFCELMRREALSIMQREGIETVYYCANQLLGLVNDVLNLSKIEAGQIEIKRHEFDLHNMIKQTFLSLLPQFKKKGLAFKLVISDDVPESVIGDEIRIRQVLNNLLINAVKYTDEGYIKLEVKRGKEKLYESLDFNLCFLVCDTGRGLKAEDVEQLFKPFVRINDYGEENTGTGLGLAITKELVEIMGGSIWYEPNGEKGSIFAFSIPLKKAKNSIKNDFESNDESLENNKTCAKGKKVLLVEDIAVNRKLISYMLKDLGYEVITAENGQKCLEVLKTEVPDVILMDMQMPVMDGYKAASIIRETGNIYIPLVALTAYAMEGDVEKCRQAGCDYYLSKPFTQEQLKNVLDECFKFKDRV